MRPRPLRSAFWVVLLAIFAPCIAQLLPNPVAGRLVFTEAGLAAALITPLVTDVSVGAGAHRQSPCYFSKTTS